MSHANTYRPVPYDPHVRVQGSDDTRMSLAGIADDHEAILEMAYRLFPETMLMNHVREHKPLVQPELLKRLDGDDIAKIQARCKELGINPLPLNMLRIGTHSFPDIAARLGTVAANPPDTIHRMQKGDRYYIGDIYAANMIASSLERVGLDFDEGRRFLDFGCSSGSLVRMLKAYRPDALLHGVDPIKEAVDWAAENIVGSTFEASSQNPPLRFADASLDGVTAVSIWSHFAEPDALAWFDEMHRCIKPGGWLFFTTHGINSIYRHCFLRILPPSRLKALFEGVLNGDFVFEEKFVSATPEGLDTQGWGNAYILRSWFVRQLGGRWDLLLFEPGANQSNQDIYVLRRR